MGELTGAAVSISPSTASAAKADVAHYEVIEVAATSTSPQLAFLAETA